MSWMVVSTPLKNISHLSLGIIIINIWKNKTCSKPPARCLSWVLVDFMVHLQIKRCLHLLVLWKTEPATHWKLLKYFFILYDFGYHVIYHFFIYVFIHFFLSFYFSFFFIIFLSFYFSFFYHFCLSFFSSSGAKKIQKMENCNFPRVFFHFFYHFFIIFF